MTEEMENKSNEMFAELYERYDEILEKNEEFISSLDNQRIMVVDPLAKLAATKFFQMSKHSGCYHRDIRDLKMLLDDIFEETLRELEDTELY